MEPKIRLPNGYQRYNYDQWLDYFRTLPAETLLSCERTLKTRISAEGYAAFKRWIEILENPSKMDKLYQGRIKAQRDENVMDLATGDNDEAFYEALIRENVTQLNSGSVSPQEVARLSQNINIFRKELREIRSRKPKTGTKLEEVLKELETPENKASNALAKAAKAKKAKKGPSRSKNA